MRTSQMSDLEFSRFLETHSVSGGNTSTVDFSGIDNSNPPDLSQFTDASGGADVGGAGGTIGSSTVGTGSSSGVSGIDLGGLINDLGSTASGLLQQVNAQNVQRLPNGQVLLPNGQVISSAPVFTSGSTGLLLVVGIGIVVLVLVMRK